MAKQTKDAKPAAEKNEEKERPQRIAYQESDEAKGANLLNEDGLLTGVPVDFDGDKHLRPNRKSFADEADFCEFRAMQDELEAQALTARAAKLREQAEQIRKFGDPGQRAKVRRAQKLAEQLKALQATLKADDIDIDLGTMLGNAE